MATTPHIQATPRRSLTPFQAILLVLTVAVPVPLVAASGLALPLPAWVEQLAVSMVPGGRELAVRRAAEAERAPEVSIIRLTGTELASAALALPAATVQAALADSEPGRLIRTVVAASASDTDRRIELPTIAAPVAGGGAISDADVEDKPPVLHTGAQTAAGDQGPSKEQSVPEERSAAPKTVVRREPPAPAGAAETGGAKPGQAAGKANAGPRSSAPPDPPSGPLDARDGTTGPPAAADAQGGGAGGAPVGGAQPAQTGTATSPSTPSPAAPAGGSGTGPAAQGASAAAADQDRRGGARG